MSIQMENGTKVVKNYQKITLKDKTFCFEVLEELSRPDASKKVFLGRFSPEGDGVTTNEGLPSPIEIHRAYCLKTALVTLPMSEMTHPQNRHFWDFFPFQGDHLREIVALGDEAQRMVDMIQDGSIRLFASGGVREVQPRLFRCAVLEPVYEPFRVEDFTTYAEKIDCMLQIIAGLKELMEDKALAQYNVVAHRDLKFNNVVVERLPDGQRRLRLIDFPTIKYYARNGATEGNHTRLGYLSPSNTAPEDVMRRFEVSAKTDVFALGTMLAEIFGVWDYKGIRNPLQLLFHHVAGINLEDTDECRRFYHELNERYPFLNRDSAGWLEQTLSQHEKNASWGNVERSCPMVRNLFRAATAIDPKHRITLNMMEEELRTMHKQLLRHDPTASDYTATDAHKVTYVLVDTSDLLQYRDAYMQALDKVQSDARHTDMVVMAYDAAHAMERLRPNPGVLELQMLSDGEALSSFLRLDEKKWTEGYRSGLKRCLFDLAGYLENETNRRDFSGEIHIFAPQAPNEDNQCCFEVSTIDVGGSITSTFLTGREICASFGQHVRIYVHTVRRESVKAENWYIPCYFCDEEPAVEKSVTETIPHTEQTADEFRGIRKRNGFHFIGGASV